MKQIIQSFRTGELKLDNIPMPALPEGYVLIQNMCSLLSAGTERNTIETAQASMIEKAKRRPDLVKQVLHNIKKEGWLSTIHKVMVRLDTPKSLGYSCAGIVRESKDFDGQFKVGDRVACAGQDYASHAEVVSVPQNLVVKIPEHVSFEEAAFTTVGAIALQGVRQAQAQIGENFCVIGLGLIGQITCQLLRANGCQVFGIDIADFQVNLARRIGFQHVVNRHDLSLQNAAKEFTKGLGFDKVIITASSSTNDPIVLATELLRKKGVMIVVGDVKMDVPREPYFYTKELEMKISTSYGPGRYDVMYEQAGIDYPYFYVRFTEKRNMETFLDLLATKSVDVKSLITHTFPLEEALHAYDVILNKENNHLAVLLKYPSEREEKFIRQIKIKGDPVKQINVGFIGAGNFAQGHLLPYLQTGDISLDTVMTLNGITATNVAKKFGFNTASTNRDDVLNQAAINTVFIATRHDSHYELVCEAIKKDKHIFVEKPLCLRKEELQEIASLYSGQKIVFVGFNRRFSPIIQHIKKELSGPLLMNYRINAGEIPAEHWIQNPEIGGGRIIGEICHFIDLMVYLCEALPKRVFASGINHEGYWRKDDNVSVTIEFDQGSLGHIVYTAMGDRGLEKERLELFSGGDCWVMEDFKHASLHRGGKRQKKISNSSKGYKEEISTFLNHVKVGQGNPILIEEIYATTLATFKIMDSLKIGMPQEVNLSEIH